MFIVPNSVIAAIVDVHPCDTPVCANSSIRTSLSERCEKNVTGKAHYEGNYIKANLQVDGKTTVFFHENYALGWVGLVNNEFKLPRKINDVLLAITSIKEFKDSTCITLIHFSF